MSGATDKEVSEELAVFQLSAYNANKLKLNQNNLGKVQQACEVLAAAAVESQQQKQFCRIAVEVEFQAGVAVLVRRRQENTMK